MGIFDFSEAKNWILRNRKSVKNRKRNFHSLRAIFERSDGRKLHYRAAGKVKQ